MNDLREKLEDLNNSFENNVKGNFAEVYEDSQIAEVDNKVIVDVKNYFKQINIIKDKLTKIQTEAECVKYEKTSNSLFGLVKEISRYEDMYSGIPRKVLNASKQAFENLLSEFNETKEKYERYIVDAKKSYNEATDYLYKMNNSDESYNYDLEYRNSKRKSHDNYLKASICYITLMSLIDNGLKKSSQKIKNDNLSEEITDDEQNTSDYVENYECEFKIGNELYRGIFTGLVDANGIPRQGEFICSDGSNVKVESSYINEKLKSRTYTFYQEDGITIDSQGVCEYDENEKLKSETHTFYQEDGITKLVNFVYEYDENENLKSETETYYYQEDGITIYMQGVCEYDENENLKSRTYTAYQEDGETKDWDRVSEYDENENLKSETETYYREDGETKDWDRVSEYDENEKLKSRTYTYYREDGITIDNKEVYEYDENELIANNIYYKEDGETKFAETVATFETDNYGDYYLKSQEATTYVYDAEDGYNYVYTDNYDEKCEHVSQQIDMKNEDDILASTYISEFYENTENTSENEKIYLGSTNLKTGLELINSPAEDKITKKSELYRYQEDGKTLFTHELWNHDETGRIISGEGETYLDEGIKLEYNMIYNDAGLIKKEGMKYYADGKSEPYCETYDK